MPAIPRGFNTLWASGPGGRSKIVYNLFTKYILKFFEKYGIIYL